VLVFLTGLRSSSVAAVEPVGYRGVLAGLAGLAAAEVVQADRRLN
jgi:hypothetical protein